MFEINLRRLIEEYPKIENSSLSLHRFKKHLKLFKEIFKESASKLKYFLLAFLAQFCFILFEVLIVQSLQTDF